MMDKCESPAPASYRITFKGQLQKNWTSMFGDITVLGTQTDCTGRITTISVSLADEAALMGLLMHLYDRGNLLVSVVPVMAHEM